MDYVLVVLEKNTNAVVGTNRIFEMNGYIKGVFMNEKIYFK